MARQSGFRLSPRIILRDEPQYFDSYVVYDAATNTMQLVDRPTLRLLEVAAEKTLCQPCLEKVAAAQGGQWPVRRILEHGWVEPSGSECVHPDVTVREPPLNWVERLDTPRDRVAVLTAPTAATLVITKRCDLACVHCNVSAGSLKAPEAVSPQRWMRVLDELEDMRVFKVTLSGGEPFVYKDFEPLFAHFASKRFHKSVLTNGTQLTPEHVRVMKEHRITPTLSLDGGDPATHDAFRRVPGSFDRLMTTLRLLRDNDVPFNIVSVIHKGSASQVDRMARIAYEHMCGQLFLVPLKAMGRGRTANRWVVDRPAYERVQRRVEEVAPRYPGLAVSFDENLEEREFGPRIENTQYEATDYGWTSCMAGKNGLVVDFDGRVYGCMVAMQLKVNPVGSVVDSSLDQVWRDGTWGVFRDPVAQGCRATWLHYQQPDRGGDRRKPLPVVATSGGQDATGKGVHEQ